MGIGGCGSYSEDKSSVGPGDTQGDDGRKKYSWLAGQGDAFRLGFAIFLYTWAAGHSLWATYLASLGAGGVPLSARAPWAPCLGWEGPTSAASPGPVC